MHENYGIIVVLIDIPSDFICLMVLHHTALSLVNVYCNSSHSISENDEVIFVC